MRAKGTKSGRAMQLAMIVFAALLALAVIAIVAMLLWETTLPVGFSSAI